MLTITKYHKHICYRKDGNRLGKRKEQIVLAKALERSMLKHEINSYAGRMGKRINCCVVGAGMAAVPRYASIGSMGTGIITINGIPYNSMDEFDRAVSDNDISQYIDFQFKARKAYKMETKLEDGDHTYYKPLEGVMLKPNVAEDRIWEAKKWEADNFYPHVVQLTNVPGTIEDEKLIMSSSAWDRIDKKLSGGFKRDELYCFGSYMSPEEFTGNPSLTMVTKLLASNNKNVVMVGLESPHGEVVNDIVEVLKDKH